MQAPKTTKIYVTCPRRLVNEAWAKLSESTGWTDEKSLELRKEFFQLTAEKAGKKKPGIRFPENFVFTRSYKTHSGRFMVVAHLSPTYNDDQSVTLTLNQFGAYFKIWESEKVQVASSECDTYVQDTPIYL